MKKKFEQPKSSVIRFTSEDVIVASGGQPSFGMGASFNDISDGKISQASLGKLGN